jgi:hypothetical protein
VRGSLPQAHGRVPDARVPIAVDDGDDELRRPERREMPSVARRRRGMVDRPAAAAGDEKDEKRNP